LSGFVRRRTEISRRWLEGCFVCELSRLKRRNEVYWRRYDGAGMLGSGRYRSLKMVVRML
jgi:hypothetical protein